MPVNGMTRDPSAFKRVFFCDNTTGGLAMLTDNQMSKVREDVTDGGVGVAAEVLNVDRLLQKR